MDYLSLTDLIFTPFVLLLIYISARLKRNRNIEKYPEYKYYIPGLTFKMVGGIGLCLVYTLYYSGGDTTQYYLDGVAMTKLLFKNAPAFFDIMRNGLNSDKLIYFDNETGYPYYHYDPQTFTVVRLTCPIILFSFRSFLVTTIIIAWISFQGLWRLYRVLVNEFPMLQGKMAIAVFFVPSVFFWGSGLLKDTITLSATGFYLYYFYNIFIRKEKFAISIFGILVSTAVILLIKPYIIFALLPGSLIWIVNKTISGIRGAIPKAAAVPVFLVFAIASGFFILNNLSGQLGQYSIDNVLQRAVVVQKDLQMDFYKGNSFDIGEYEATIPSMLSKAPKAIEAAIFRPYIFEARNVVMVVSAIENTFFLLFTIKILFMLRVFGIIKYFFKHHLLTFCLVFSLFFAFSVGISTSNFGSLVRYKIPCLPFFVASLFIIQYYHKSERRETAEGTPAEAEVVTLRPA